MTRLNLVTLGEAGLYAAERSELLLGPGKPLALLIFLALTPGRRVSREFLLDLLWADLDPDRARAALRQVLFHLRRLLGEHALPGIEELTLAGPIDTDRDQFLGAIERGDLDLAVSVYTGAFLPAFGVPGGAAFEQWADLERDRLRAALLRSGELLVRRRLNQSRFREAQRLARQVRDEAPHAEAAWRLVLETAVAGHDFVAAAVEADALEGWAVAEELLLEPATRVAIARARQVSPAANDPEDTSALVAELTGREREFATITAAWEAARTGPPRHVHLTAPAGLGKTRLLLDVVARLRAGGAPVVEIRGAAGERDIPYALAGDLALAVASQPGAAGIAPASAAALIALNSTLSSRLAGTADLAVGEEALRRRIHALTDLLLSVADEKPFVLVIDDLHWADALSFRVLEGVFARLGRAHVLCLTAARPERSPSGDGITRVPLAGLTPSQVGSLVTALGAVPSDAQWSRDFVAGLHQATAGSPLQILETLRLAMDEGVLLLEGAEWHCVDKARLASLLKTGEALRQRIRSLPRQQAWVLALLATAGTPIPPDPLAVAAGIALPELDEALRALERQGLVTRAGPGWLPVHDEIGATARDALDPLLRAGAERSIAELLVGSAGADPHRVLRGMRHFLAAGDEAAIPGHFRRYVLLLRQQRDRRPAARLAAELLGEHATEPRVAMLVGALPLHWRLGLWSLTRQGVAAAALIVIAGAVTLLIRADDAQAAALQRLVYVDSTQGTTVVAADQADWDGRSDPVGPARGRSLHAEAALAFPELAPSVSPDGHSVAWTQDAGDSTTLDIWLRTPAGSRRLTRQLRDDLVTGWLPDGSALIGLTNRWSSPAVGNYDVAVFDTATGAARQITGGPSHDQTPIVSPDGTRVAFLRESDESAPLLCVAAMDGMSAPDCRSPGGYPIQQVLGWGGLVELIVILDSAGARPLVRYDWQRNTSTRLLGPQVYRARLSPDRRWVVGAVRIEGIRGFRDWVIPLDRPAWARRVESRAGEDAVLRWWEGQQDRSELIDRIELQDTMRVIMLGFGTRLGIRALASNGTEIPVHAPVRWSSGDTLVAVVDSGGDVLPRSRGAVTISASLAGWRTDRRFEVRGEPALTVVDERWDDRWRDRWITFGDPHPTVTTGPGTHPSFWNQGDGTFTSTAVLRQSFSARQGLGVEVRLSTAVTRANWQRSGTVLVSGMDTAAFRGADQRKASPSTSRFDALCGAGYPGGAGGYGQGRLAVNGGTSQSIDLGATAKLLGSGAWWTLRIQILPDGRCGIAVNGVVLWLSPDPIPLDDSFWLRLGDESAETRFLHGRLQVWTGVRTDLDWARGPK